MAESLNQRERHEWQLCHDEPRETKENTRRNDHGVQVRYHKHDITVYAVTQESHNISNTSLVVACGVYVLRGKVPGKKAWNATGDPDTPQPIFQAPFEGTNGYTA